MKLLLKLKQLCIVGAHFDNLNGLLDLICAKNEAYEVYGDLSPKQEFEARRRYSFEGIYIDSAFYKGNGMEFIAHCLSSFMMEIRN